MIGLAGLIEAAGNQGEKKARLKPGAEKLKELAASYSEKRLFKPGDLVMWKPGLKNRTVPDYGEPAVVLDMKPGQIATDKGSGSGYHLEPLELRIGIYGDHEDFDGFWMDANRFQPYAEFEPEPVPESALSALCGMDPAADIGQSEEQKS